MRNLTRLLIATALLGAAVISTQITQPTPVASAATVPAGFTDSGVASLNSATTVEWLPNNRIVVLEQAGAVQVAVPGGSFSPAVTLDVCLGSERGLLGLTPDPGFLGNGHVYIYYTRTAPGAPGGCVNRVSRFTMQATAGGATIDAASELVLLDNISSVNGNHNGGDLDIGGDGLLYVSVGDAGRDPRGDSGSAGSNDAAQDLSLLNGKILRITLDGQPAPTNPFMGSGTARCATRGNTASTPTTTCQEIYAYGLRNPYRIAFDRDGVGFAINDVGQRTFEEVNEGVLGANYGWPTREGPCPQGQTPPCDGPPNGLTDPITAYERSEGQYITAGAFVPAGLWPAGFDDAYLFADGGSGQIWVRYGDQAVDYSTPFATGASGISDMTFGFDADGRMVLYYVQQGSGLRKVSPEADPSAQDGSTMAFRSITPKRVYDSGELGIRLVGGTTHAVDTDLPSTARAALVNLTLADTAGPGFLRVWNTDGLRPQTSTSNADGADAFVANAAVVPLDSDGRFIVETTTTARVIADVMGWFEPVEGAVEAGRFVALTPQRITDTREVPGDPNDPASDNRFVDTADGIKVSPLGTAGLPNDGSVDSVAISIGALASDETPGGYVGAYPSGSSYPGTSNVNVLGGDVRANMVVVPLGADGAFNLKMLNIQDVVVDVLGYFTSASAPEATSGRFAFLKPNRLVDTRREDDIDRLTGGETSSIRLFPPYPSSALVQNVTVASPAGPGWLAAHPDGIDIPEVSSLNFTGAGQTRAVLAFTTIPDNDRIAYTSLVDADVIADAIGLFTE